MDEWNFGEYINRFESALDYVPGSLKVEADPDDGDGVDATVEVAIDRGQEKTRGETINAILKNRDRLKKEGADVPTFSDDKGVKRSFANHWFEATVLPSRLKGGELAAAAIIRASLKGPWAFECWFGPKRASEWSTMSKTTWLRNREGLETKGLIEIQSFGEGAAPIIYIIVPGLSYRSVFAPSYRSAKKKKRGRR